MRRPKRRQGTGAAKFVGGKMEMSGKMEALKVVRLEWKDGKMSEVPGSEFTLPADLVLLAMGVRFARAVGPGSLQRREGRQRARRGRIPDGQFRPAALIAN